MSQIAAILGAGGFFSLVAAIICWDYLPTWKRILWLFSPVCLSLFSVLSGGRQTVLQLLLFIFFSLRIRKGLFRSSRLKVLASRVVLCLVFSLILFYGMMVSFQRNSRQEEISKKDMILKVFRAHFPSEVDKGIGALPEIARDGTAELIIYFTHSIPNFLVFWEQKKPGPYLGMWEFPFVARRFNNLGVVQETVMERIEHVYELFAVTGRFAQVWQTQVRDLIIDFTPGGALVVLLLFGFFSGRITRNYELKGGLVLAFLVVGLNLLCFYTILLSGISDTFIFFYFTACSLMLIMSRFNRYDFVVTKRTSG